MEKQKLRYNYVLTERQLRRAVADVKKEHGATGGRRTHAGALHPETTIE